MKKPKRRKAKKKRKRQSRMPAKRRTSEASILTKVRRTCLCLKLVGRLYGRNTGQNVAAARMAGPELV
jgi:hypothetical protein